MIVDLYIFSPFIQFCCVVGTDRFRIVLSSWLVSLLFLCSNLLSLSAIPDSSVGKESTCNAGDSSFDSWVRKICWRRDMLPTPVFLGFPGGSPGKESVCNAGDLGSIPGLEDPLEKGMTTHSNIRTWRIPWIV